MLNAIASLKCLKKCLHNEQKPTCHEEDKRFLFVAIPTFDIGSLWTIFVCFHGSEKRVVQVVLKRTILIFRVAKHSFQEPMPNSP